MAREFHVGDTVQIREPYSMAGRIGTVVDITQNSLLEQYYTCTVEFDEDAEDGNSMMYVYDYFELKLIESAQPVIPFNDSVQRWLIQ